MHYIELNMTDGGVICLPVGSFLFLPNSRGGCTVRLLNGSASPMLVQESYKSIVNTLSACANAYVYRPPE